MKKLIIPVIIVLVILMTIPLLARGRRSRKMEVSPLTLSLYGGLEDITGEVYEDMYYSFGADAIVPVVNPMRIRIGLANVALHENSTTMNFGTGISADVMYYFQMPMAFLPYGFGGLWYGSYSNATSTSDMHLRIGLGGEMVTMYNFFAEFGLDYVSFSNGESVSYNPMFVHAGMRIPLFK